VLPKFHHFTSPKAKLGGESCGLVWLKPGSDQVLKLMEAQGLDQTSLLSTGYKVLRVALRVHTVQYVIVVYIQR
jgi:hypothetical protein